MTTTGSTPPAEGLSKQTARKLDRLRRKIEEQTRTWDSVVAFVTERCQKNYAINGVQIQGQVDVGYIAELHGNYILQAGFRTRSGADPAEQDQTIYFVYFPNRTEPELSSFSTLEDAVEQFLSIIEEDDRRESSGFRRFLLEQYLSRVGVPGTLAVLALVLAVLLEIVSTTPNELWTLCVAAFAFYFGTRSGERSSRVPPDEPPAGKTGATGGTSATG
ncbi:hypothetical protein [Falsiroseomonas oryzae]|uniref:hypothetical protein n=1 Tax=Falsiroseomonas oryzae TaxID=2766473 RepID=UPI0022EAFD42|nr:hypothetical protein [Roseomonas sp. MO-31]